MRLNINTDAAVVFTAKLERLRRSALPVAIRGALNSAAFDVKKDTMPAAARGAFTQRKPAFFKATSKVLPAQGFDIKRMQAQVGFAGKDQAVEDLQQQEEGGRIGGRALVPLRQARAGASQQRSVRAAARVGAVRGRIIDSRRAKAGSARQRFIKSAVHAGKGGYVLGNKNKGAGRILFQVRSLKRVRGRTFAKLVPLYSVNKGRAARVKATHFMREASEQSAGKLERFYIAEAKKQLRKAGVL